MQTILTFVGSAPVVSVSDPVAVAAIKVPRVKVGEDGSESVVDHVLDGFVLRQNKGFNCLFKLLIHHVTQMSQSGCLQTAPMGSIFPAFTLPNSR